MKILLTLTLTLASFFSWSQDLLDRFLIEQYNGQVHLNWIMSKGSTCFGIDVERGVDGVNFELLHHIEGICGAEDEPTPYNFTDSEPIGNTISYYRLKLGTQGYSETRTIEVIKLNDDGFLIQPNPVVDNSRIYFNNSTGMEHILRVFNLKGELVSQKNGNLKFFDISTSELPSGLLIFSIERIEGGESKNGKIIVQSL